MTGVPEILQGSHVGNLLEKSGSTFSLSDGLEALEAAFGESARSAQTAKQITAVLFEAKQQVASVYMAHLIGPPERDLEHSEALGRFWSALARWSIETALQFVWRNRQSTRHMRGP